MNPPKKPKATKQEKLFSAVALIEFDSIAVGITASDAMVKKAPLAMLKAGTIHPGKYLVMVGGEVAAVEESYREGLSIGREAIVDDVILPDIHRQTLDGIEGKKAANNHEALGVIETSTVASNINAADAAVKGANVVILEIRLADGLGGHSFTLFGGKVADVEAAIQIGTERIRNKDIKVHTTIVPQVDKWLASEIALKSRFFGQGDSE
jgi:microcompartment protein CcmL/EutN